MDSKAEVFLVGGPHDGETRLIDNHADSIVVPFGDGLPIVFRYVRKPDGKFHFAPEMISRAGKKMSK